jgi:spore germination cell wall hydrolase CwlJ-like protein
MSAEGRAKFALFLLTLLAFGGVVVVTLLLLVLVSGKGHAATCPPPDPAARPIVKLAAGELRSLAALAWAENRSSGYCGMLSIASVVVNRLQQNPKIYGATITQVINKPYQFSVFGRTDPNRRKMAKVAEDDDEFVTAVLAAIAAVSGVENTGRALYFYSGRAPYWSHGMVVTAKQYGHVFLKPRP